MKAYCIADEDTVRGFRLAGVLGEAVSTPREAAAALARARDLPDCGLVLVTEEAFAELGPELESVRATRDRPVVVVLPRPGGPAPGARGVDAMVRSLLGAEWEDEP